MAAFHVEKYSLSALGDLLNKCSYNGEGYTESKSHLPYFDQYLRDIGTKTILVEEDYTDRDYLEDYTAYYARCHADYSRRCTRIHFFDQDLTRDQIEELLQGNSYLAGLIQQAYLGFAVIKPLPSTIFGRTCLVTYGNRTKPRMFPSLRTYRAHLFGVELRVQSLAFQEQDADVAACATSALWSAFHATGILFQHPIHSPAEITKAASAHLRSVDRTLPASSGLSAEQMADAIRSVGLEPLQINAENSDLLRMTIRAYLSAKVPCILIGAVFNGAENKELGMHAVTVAGYSSRDATASALPYGQADTLLGATRMEKIYAHDDQVGPFARMEFLPSVTTYFTTSWIDDTGTRGNIYFEPTILLVPLYHKIRVPVTALIATVCTLDAWVGVARRNGFIKTAQDIEWDLRLADSSDLKAELFDDKSTNSELRLLTLQGSLPHFIWVAAAQSAGERLFELHFDATDLLQGDQLTGGLAHDQGVCAALGAFFSNATVKAYVKRQGTKPVEAVQKWFEKNRNKF